jgi:hypothetical protein
MTRFMTKTKALYPPVFPSIYIMRKSQLGIEKLISNEKNNAKKARLKEIKKDLVAIQKDL